MRPSMRGKAWTVEAVEAWSHPEPNTGCWLWSGTYHRSGYGAIRMGHRLVGAHRVAYQVATGVDPGRLFVCHRCDQPACVNPGHLFLGTAADNNRDMTAKRRQCSPGGESSGKNTLVAAQVVEIRRSYGAGGVSLNDLAVRFGVSVRAVHKVVRRETWRATDA